MASDLAEKGLAAILKVSVFAFFAVAGALLFGWALSPGGYFAQVPLSLFCGAAVANALAVRIYERGKLHDVGLPWNAASVRNLLLGIGGGMGAAVVVLAPPLLFRLSRLAPSPLDKGNIQTLVFLTVMLLFGAMGEELLFHGYGFQVLLAALGPYAAIPFISAIFAIAHSANLNVSPLALLNTGLWGMALGYAFWRSGDLWLPIGLHFGWNWTLPLFGVNLSGFKMNVTGYLMQWNIPALWSGGEYGPEGGLLTTLVVMLLAVYLWKAPARRQVPLLMKARWEA